MRNLRQRIRKLESRLTDATTLVPHSEEWFTYWESILDRYIAGEEPEHRGNVPLEVVDRLIERADHEEALTRMNAIMPGSYE